MRAADIKVGEAYAYATGSPKYHLLKATALAAPAHGGTQVRISHPDVEVTFEERWVENRHLLGPWLGTPQPRDPGYEYVRKLPVTDPQVRSGREAMSYAESATAEYADVLAQRIRAVRLTKLGFPRLLADYAGQGGTYESSFEERMQRREAGLPPLHTNVLRFDPDEIDLVLDRLEGQS